MLEFATFAMVTLMFIPFALDKGKVALDFAKGLAGKLLG
jgi:hypothetical protein